MDIIPRAIQVDFGKVPVTPFDWYDNDPAITEFFHALSVHFPAGETFFIESVAQYAVEIQTKSPELWQKVKLFFKQEGMHTHVHEVWDTRVQLEFGHDMDAYERNVAERLGRLKKILPYISQLALTSCLEHFTASMARLLLDSKSGRYLQMKSAEPFRSLWRWHAIEELEHKDVAFDVYQLVGGGYVHRCLMMMVVGPMFVMRTLITWYYLIRERKLPVLRSMSTLVKFLIWKPGIMSQTIPSMLEWFLPWYHPSMLTYKTDSTIVARYAAMLKLKEKQGVIHLGPDVLGNMNNSIVSASPFLVGKL